MTNVSKMVYRKIMYGPHSKLPESDVNKLAKSIGVKLSRRNHKTLANRMIEASWNGYTIAQGNRCDGLDCVIHDIAHWLVASPKRRSIPNFGLGPDPEGGPNTPLVLHPDAAYREESRVCTVNILLVHFMGGNWRNVANWLNCPDIRINTYMKSPESKIAIKAYARLKQS